MIYSSGLYGFSPEGQMNGAELVCRLDQALDHPHLAGSVSALPLPSWGLAPFFSCVPNLVHGAMGASYWSP